MIAQPASTGSRVLDDVAKVIGAEAACALARRFGGQRIYIPRRMETGHAIDRAIGTASAQLLAEFYGGTDLVLPMRVRQQVLVRELASRSPPLTRQQIAEQAGVTERMVYRLLARPDDRQPDLFAAPLSGDS